MSAISETIVREFLEASGFLVQQGRKFVAPSLPASRKLRRESVEFLRSKGVDGVIEFPAVLSTVIDAVEKNRNYQRSDVLQLIRVLKAHGMLREPQLELFRAAKPRRAARKPKP